MNNSAAREGSSRHIFGYRFIFGVVQYGHILEYQHSLGVSFSYQNISIHEFQGFNPPLEKNPYVDLDGDFLLIGYGHQIENIKMEINIGMGMGEGTFRGDFISKNYSICDPELDNMFCVEGQAREKYEFHRINGIVYTVGYSVEYHYKNIAFGVRPQVYFTNEAYSFNVHLLAGFFV